MIKAAMLLNRENFFFYSVSTYYIEKKVAPYNILDE
jgi:hypothetical protein